MANLHLDMHELTQLARAWSRAPELVNDELRAAMYLSTGMLHAEVVDNTPAGASGGSGAGLSGSISYNVTATAGVVTGVVGTPSPYAIPVELGTRPHMPPVEPIKEWVEARLGMGSDAAKSVAYAIAVKIKKDGTKGKFMFRDSLRRLMPDIERTFRAAIGRVINRLGDMA